MSFSVQVDGCPAHLPSPEFLLHTLLSCGCSQPHPYSLRGAMQRKVGANLALVSKRKIRTAKSGKQTGSASASDKASRASPVAARGSLRQDNTISERVAREKERFRNQVIAVPAQQMPFCPCRNAHGSRFCTFGPCTRHLSILQRTPADDDCSDGKAACVGCPQGRAFRYASHRAREVVAVSLIDPSAGGTPKATGNA